MSKYVYYKLNNIILILWLSTVGGGEGWGGSGGWPQTGGGSGIAMEYLAPNKLIEQLVEDLAKVMAGHRRSSE